MGNPQTPRSPGSSIMATIGFTSAEIHFLKQGLTKVIAESRKHSVAIAETPAPSPESTEVMILGYYEKRIAGASALQKRLDLLQEELQRKQNLSVAHNS